MSRAALYRLYRPQNFDEVEGQLHIAATLRNAAKEQHFAQAYLFTGTRGTGKTSMARIVAKAINCLAQLPDGNPCNICEMCMSATQGRLVDLIEIDAASNSRVEEMRNLLEQSQYQPAQGKKKIYIIDEVHMLSSSAFNALLKTLEEPPAHIHFILATTEQHKVLPTIISRCQVFHFLPLTIEQIVARLRYVVEQEHIHIEPEALESIAHHAKGGMRDALSILERLLSSDDTITAAYINEILGVSSIDVFQKLYQEIQAKNAQGALQLLQEEQRRGTAPDTFSRGLKNFLRNALLKHVHATGMNADAMSLLRLIDRLEMSLAQMKYADIPWLQCELGILEAVLNDEEVHTIPASTHDKQPTKTQTPKRRTSNAPIKTPSVAQKNATASTPRVDASEDSEEGKIFQKLKSSWASLSFKIADPIVRTAVKSIKPISLEKGVLSLQGQSSVQITHLGKPEGSSMLKEALLANYGINVDIHLLLADTPQGTRTSPQPTSTQQSNVEAPNEKEASAKKEEEVLKLADFFGGSVLD